MSIYISCKIFSFYDEEIFILPSGQKQHHNLTAE